MKKIITFSIICAIFFAAFSVLAPFITHAQEVSEDGQTIANIEAQIQQLQTIVAVLESQVTALTIAPATQTNNRSAIASVIAALSFPSRSTTNADLNSDNTVDTDDVKILINSWGVCQSEIGCPTDLNNDDAVDTADLDILFKSWTN